MVEGLKILKNLKKEYPDAHCSLEYKTPFQLLVATVLSAQCTDERVNKTTPGLFQKFPTPEKMASASISVLEDIVRPTGFYKNKAKALQALSTDIVQKHEGQVPRTMQGLTDLRGVGRKTANVVLGNAFGIQEGIVVDTHVGRLSRRMGFTRHEDPVKVEADLVKWVPRKDWALFSHLMISHGRKYCMARKPNCEHCPLLSICPRRGIK